VEETALFLPVSVFWIKVEETALFLPVSVFGSSPAPIDEKPIGVYARPINYDEMEMRKWSLQEEKGRLRNTNGFYLEHR